MLTISGMVLVLVAAALPPLPASVRLRGRRLGRELLAVAGPLLLSWSWGVAPLREPVGPIAGEAGWRLISAGLVIAAMAVLWLWLRRRPLPSPLCRRCGHDVRNLVEPRCPECGTPFGRRGPRTSRRGAPVIGVTIVLLCAAGLTIRIPFAKTWGAIGLVPDRGFMIAWRWLPERTIVEWTADAQPNRAVGGTLVARYARDRSGSYARLTPRLEGAITHSGSFRHAARAWLILNAPLPAPDGWAMTDRQAEQLVESLEGGSRSRAIAWLVHRLSLEGAIRRETAASLNARAQRLRALALRPTAAGRSALGLYLALGNGSDAELDILLAEWIAEEGDMSVLLARKQATVGQTLVTALLAIVGQERPDEPSRAGARALGAALALALMAAEGRLADADRGALLGHLVECVTSRGGMHRSVGMRALAVAGAQDELAEAVVESVVSTSSPPGDEWLAEIVLTMTTSFVGASENPLREATLAALPRLRTVIESDADEFRRFAAATLVLAAIPERDARRAEAVTAMEALRADPRSRVALQCWRSVEAIGLLRAASLPSDASGGQ